MLGLTRKPDPLHPLKGKFLIWSGDHARSQVPAGARRRWVKSAFFTGLFLCRLIVGAENVSQAWVQRYSEPVESTDAAEIVAVDPRGSVIIAGTTDDGTTGNDFLVMKYSGTGSALWTNRYNGPGNGFDQVVALAVDSSGNVLVAGYSENGADQYSEDFVTVKFSANGALLWVNRFDGPDHATDLVNAMAVDINGDVVVSGTSTGYGTSSGNFVTIKYTSGGLVLWTNTYSANGAPRSAAVNIEGDVFVTGTTYDFSGATRVTLKYSRAGNLVWSRLYKGPGQDDTGQALVVDGTGNVIVTGCSDGSDGYDFLTIKYSSTGTVLWTQRYAGSAASQDFARAIAVDSGGNTFVTGASYGGISSYDYATVAYSPSGVALWTNRYNGPENLYEMVNGVAVGPDGKVFVTGNADTATSDYVTIAYSGAGVPLWTNRYSGPGNKKDSARSLVVDGAGDVYVTGYSIANTSDWLTIKYTASGAEVWTCRFNGVANTNDFVTGITVDESGSALVTGYVFGAGTKADYLTVKYSESGGAVWTNRYSGPGKNDERANGVAVDKCSGKVFVAGYACTGTAVSSADYATVAYSGFGLPLWTNYYAGSANLADVATALAVDGNGDVFVTGSSAAGGYAADFTTIKYSGVGVPLWTNRYRGPGNCTNVATAIAASGEGKLIVTGYSQSAVNPTSSDYATVAYSIDGTPLWTNRYNGPGNNLDRPVAVAVDGSGRVFVSGSSYNGSTASSADYATVAYSETGIPLWTNRYSRAASSGDNPAGIALDAGGNVVVSGSSDSSIVTVKYSGSGMPLWTNRFTGGTAGKAVAVDRADNIVVVGVAYDSTTANDYLTLKYRSDGLLLWTSRYNGPASRADTPQTSSCLGLGADGAVLVTGASAASFRSGTSYDYSTLKLISSPAILSQPASRTNNAGSLAAFNVSAYGGGPFAYQWRKDGANLLNGGRISGATTATLGFAAVQSSDAGRFSVVVTNIAGSITSAPAILQVVTPSDISLADPSFTEGTFTVSFTNTPGASFSVVTTTNLSLPVGLWPVLGGIVEVVPGLFQFTDPQTTNASRRFYRVRSL